MITQKNCKHVMFIRCFQHMHLQMVLITGLRGADSSQGGCFYNGIWVWASAYKSCRLVIRIQF